MTTVSPFSGSPASASEVPLASPAFSIPSSINNNSDVTASTTTTKSTTATTKTANGKPKSKPRKRVNTAEKRHQHNAIERQRRETLNGKFIVLARLLPALASHRRPSKSAIVNGSITHLSYQREQRLLAVNLLRQITAEHDELLKEVNEWRRTSGFAPKAANNTWSETIEELAGVEKEVFGTFANVDGEDEDGDDNDNDMEPQFDQANFSALPVFNATSTGLITPRPSTDISSNGNMLNNVYTTESRVPTANNATFNWSNDFAWSMTNQAPVATPTFPLSMYMGESLENANTDSPATSQQGMVVTPPTYTEMMQNPSSSPGSSNGIAPSLEDVKPTANVQAAMSTWTPAQILFAHQQLQLQRQQQQQQQALRQQQQQQQQQAAAAFASSFTPNGVNIADPDLDLFTQQLMSSMFNPAQAAPAPTQIEQWRRNALNSVPARPVIHHQTSVHDLRNAVRLGMGAAGVPGWQESGVEGF